MLVLPQTSTASGGASTAGHVPVQGDDSDDDDDDDDCNDDDDEGRGQESVFSCRPRRRAPVCSRTTKGFDVLKNTSIGGPY